jgi:hypothetical protein
MATRIHRSLEVIAFNANGFMRQRYELNKQLQDLHVDVALFSVTHLKPHERFFISNYHIYRTDRQAGRKGGTALVVRRDVPHNYVDLQPLVPVEATGVYIPIGNSEVLLFSVLCNPAFRRYLPNRCLSMVIFVIIFFFFHFKHPHWADYVYTSVYSYYIRLQPDIYPVE